MAMSEPSLPVAQRLSGARALVVAASRGLGFAIARELAAEGAKVVFSGRDMDRLLAARQTVPDQAARLFPRVIDVEDSTSIEVGVRQAVKDLGGLDMLVTNCGGPRAGAFDNLSDDDWQVGIRQVLLSAIRLVRAALPALRRSRAGRIVSVVSSSVRQPVDHVALSNVLRPAVAAFVSDLAGTVAKDGIFINALAPGRFDTERVKELDEKAAARQGISLEEAIRNSAARIPVGRYGRPEEFARAASFLLSPDNTYITGQCLFIDGGLVRGR